MCHISTYGIHLPLLNGTSLYQAFDSNNDIMWRVDFLQFLGNCVKYLPELNPKCSVVQNVINKPRPVAKTMSYADCVYIMDIDMELMGQHTTRYFLKAVFSTVSASFTIHPETDITAVVMCYQTHIQPIFLGIECKTFHDRLNFTTVKKPLKATCWQRFFCEVRLSAG
ncbi:hypothetical protein PMAC_002036 [Pneumocystis sp. 'macacae']|nr:hypothetical protein PMAC_002036 [Pneumocystis sp. 'macacae']